MPEYRTHHQTAGRIGGLVSRARRTNEDHRLARAAEGRMARFLNQVPADVTDPGERMNRALLLQRAEMTRIAARSADRRRVRPRDPRPGPAAAGSGEPADRRT